MDPTSPIRTHHSPERSEGELPASFFDKLGEFQEFSHTREFKTDPFATPFSHGLNRTKPQPLFKDELYFEPNVVRVERTRASSLSMPALLTFPQSSVSSAFGPATFASGWNVPTDPKLLNSQEDPFNIITVEEPEDSNALARTIDALGLDDPVNSPIHSPTLNTQNLNTSNTSNRVRSISVSFPQDTAGDNIPMVGTFGRPLSALELTSSFTPTKKHSEEESWDQVTERVSVHVNSPSKESASGIDRSMTESPLHEFMAPSRSLWIGNIDSTFGSDELFQIFSRFGVIESIRMLPEKECAFVNYIRLEDALSAREQMQGGRIGSCIVRIGFGKTDAIHDNQGMQPTKSLWVGNILPTTKPADLELIFSRFGTVESARVLTHKNCGFVNFINLEDAMTARSELNGQEIGGSIVKIGFAKVPSRPEPPLSVAQALNSPLAIAGLAAAAIERSFYPSGASNYQSYGGNGAWGNPQSHMGLGSPIRNQREDLLGNSDGDIYAPGIIQIPESNPCRKIDQNRLRDIRKRLESHITTRDLEMIFAEVIDDAVDLCSDYIGNVVIQKIMEKCSDVLRLRLIEAVSPRMASLGIHKNGTWAVQKIIDCAKTAPQIEAIVTTLKVYAPALLLDQYGNYVIQCCLRLGTHRNQFIFDAMAAKCWELGQGRFGARAMKACLESQFTSKEQQKQVAVAIAQNCVQLCMNSNGSILITWLTDMSGILIRYRMLAPLLLQHLSSICSHKLASTTVLKIGNIIVY
ncbi:armadillo-type protein [Globomyces pollinis-pini]|nr:armadillo-type protein [Globomyces pollinis-pini]